MKVEYIILYENDEMLCNFLTTRKTAIIFIIISTLITIYMYDNNQNGIIWMAKTSWQIADSHAAVN